MLTLNAKLNPICHLLALLAHPILYVSRIRVNAELRSRRKSTIITYSEGASVALVIQHAMRLRHVILWSVAYLAVPYFSTLSHKEHDFLEKVIEYKTRVLISKTCVWNIFHYKKN
jgi:hypothetical protein